MEKEELKAMFQEELKSFKENSNFLTKEGMQTVLDSFKADMQKEYGNSITKESFDKSFENLSKDLTSRIEKIRKEGSEGKSKTLKELLVDKSAEIDKFLSGEAKNVTIRTTQKDVYSANFTGSDYQRLPGVAQLHRGQEYMRNLLTIVPLGSNTFDGVSWWEQETITNNAGNVAEIRTVGSQSNLTWIQKTLQSARIFDYIKVGVDRIKDVDFVMGEIQQLIYKNMKLKENDQLLNGTGLSNQVKGVLAYATAFDTNIAKIQDANIIDLLGKIKTQIDKDTLGGAMPNTWIANRIDVDSLRYKKDTENRYMFEAWALGNTNVNVGGMAGVENALVAENTLLAGDLSLATLFVWDDLVIEMGRTEDDMLKGLVTITAYIRENVRVKDVDKKAIVKVSDLAQTLADITKPQA